MRSVIASHPRCLIPTSFKKSRVYFLLVQKAPPSGCLFRSHPPLVILRCTTSVSHSPYRFQGVTSSFLSIRPSHQCHWRAAHLASPDLVAAYSSVRLIQRQLNSVGGFLFSQRRKEGATRMALGCTELESALPNMSCKTDSI